MKTYLHKPIKSISFTWENSKMFNLTLKYFSIFNNKPPGSLVVHILHVIIVRIIVTVLPYSGKTSLNLKLVSAIFHQIFIFSSNDIPSNTMKNVFFSSKKLFWFSRYWNFCNFSLHFQTFQIQKNKWKWNNLWCHELICINLQL